MTATGDPGDVVVIHLSDIQIGFHQGLVAFRREQPCPPCPPDSEFDGRCTRAAARWIGYMTERFREYERRRKTAIMLGCDPESVQPADYV